MITTQRGTSAVSIAPTQNQNTAPVYEFECLFTHDLRKKRKTWHDGSLRFHTFNRRVMVYDESKNFVGDLHYRDADELQEGEELRLDKGVLVDVGRRIGQTDTDLTEVLDRGRHGDEGPQARHETPAATHLSIQRLPSASVQDRPKSLAAVLGASQGPIGRARIAIKSPYEQLHAARPESVFEQPPAKRQKIAAGKENAPLLSKIARTEAWDKTRPRLSEISASTRVPLVWRQDIDSSKTVIELSSDDESTHSPTFSSAFGSSRSRQKGTKVMRNPLAKLDLAPKPPRPRQNLLSKPVTLVEPTKGASNPLPAQKVPARPASSVDTARISAKVIGNSKALAESVQLLPNVRKSTKAQGKQMASILPDLSARSARLSSGPRSRLRFAPQKIRPKLMYKDLLPSSFIASRPDSSKGASFVSPIKDKSNDEDQSAAPMSGPTRRLTEDIFELSSLESIQSQQQVATTSARSRVRLEPISPAHQASYPLFVSQGSGIAMPTPERRKADSPTVPSPMRTPMQNPTSMEETSLDDEPLQISPAIVVKPIPASEIPPVSKLTLMDQRLMIPPPRSEQSPPQMGQRSLHLENIPPQVAQIPVELPPETPQPRPFRRTLSENDSPAKANTRPIVISPTVHIPSALNGMQQRALALSPDQRRPFKSPAKLQRSQSDGGAMLQIEKLRPIGDIIPAVTKEEEDARAGPWSAREAFLLFDWWPPGRQKPEYAEAHDDVEKVQERPITGFMHPRNAECFGQCQGVIRDGIDI